MNESSLFFETASRLAPGITGRVSGHTNFSRDLEATESGIEVASRERRLNRSSLHDRFLDGTTVA